MHSIVSKVGLNPSMDYMISIVSLILDLSFGFFFSFFLSQIVLSHSLTHTLSLYHTTGLCDLTLLFFWFVLACSTIVGKDRELNVRQCKWCGRNDKQPPSESIAFFLLFFLLITFPQVSNKANLLKHQNEKKEKKQKHIFICFFFAWTGDG